MQGHGVNVRAMIEDSPARLKKPLQQSFYSLLEMP